VTALERFHPLVRQWFEETLGAPSAPQRDGWPAIAAGDHTLLLAPTGSGKTLAAFLWEVNQLIEAGRDAPLPNSVQILYVSPLKALNNDVQRNLEAPLAELSARFTAAGEPFPDIRVAVRTGDTPSSARARMLRRSPHILITTPESLHIMLTSVRGRGMFSGVRAVIVDEIHALAGTKRGAHLALTLERLEELTLAPPQRIGLSATQRPLSEVARFLCGARDGEPRPCTVVDCGLVKAMEVAVESPVDDLAHVGGTVWRAVTPLALRHILTARSTLVFVNNRGQAERMAARINALAGEEIALPYHGSLSRERRFALEQSLKAGAVRALVSTSSLELGIDIGSVDLVLQLQSPKRVSNALQRVGRAGHSLAAVSRGVFVPTFRDDAMEMLAIVRAMREGDVEPTRVVQNALDVLAQVVVAIVAIDDGWTSAALYTLVRRAYPYHDLSRAAFDAVLDMLAGRFPLTSRALDATGFGSAPDSGGSDALDPLAAEVDVRLSWDRMSDVLTAARSSRLVAVTSGGTIPDRGLYTVNLPDRSRIGELDEEFVHETRVGGVFQLGSSTWRVQTIEHDRVIVIPAPGAPARMPFWHGEYAARAAHLAPRMGEQRRALGAAASDDDMRALATRYDADANTVASLVEYVHEQRAVTGVVPDDRTFVIEQFRDETDSLRVIVHAPFGGRVNAPWGMALSHRVREWLASPAQRADQGVRFLDRPARAPNQGVRFLDPAPGAPNQGVRFLDPARGPRFEVQVQTTDDGIMLRLPHFSGAVPLEVLTGLTPDEARQRVLEEVGSSSLFGARFRMNAARALLLPRGNPRRRMPLWLQRLKALDLLEAVRQYPSFPLLVETYRDVFQDAFDMPALNAVLTGLLHGDMGVHPVRTDAPSPFAVSLQFGFVVDWMYADDAPRAEQRAALLSLDRALLDELMGTEGADAGTLTVLEEVLARRRGTSPERRARTADELAVLLDRAGDLTLAELHARVASVEEGRRGDPIAELLGRGRAIGVSIPTGAGTADDRIILAEHYARYAAAFGAETLGAVRAGVDLAPSAADDVVPSWARSAVLTPQAAQRELVVRFVALGGVVSVDDIVRRYDVEPDRVQNWLEDWARAGRLVQGRFGGTADVRWCSRRLLEQARRRELAQARRAIEAVDFAAYARFVMAWQSVAGTAAAQSDQATPAATVRQLYGFAAPAQQWMSAILPTRHAEDDALLARMISAGEMLWIGVPPAAASDSGGRFSIRFVKRGTARAWQTELAAPEPPLSPQAAAVRGALEKNGASFLDEIGAATTLSTRAVRDGLRELVALGMATNDTMAALEAVAHWRPLVSPRERNQPDPTRWLPDDFQRSKNFHVVQRRPNLRRLPKWRRPDLPGAEDDAWPGRWSLTRVAGVLGGPDDDAALAAVVARQWLDRYGVLSREVWRRERPAVPWRAVYAELKHMEYRGEVRRGYFVRGLTGAQFAAPAAVELLRAPAPPDAEAPIVILTAGDPANAYGLLTSHTPEEERDQFVRPRGKSTLLVCVNGVVIVLIDRVHPLRLRIRPGVDADQLTRVIQTMLSHIATSRRDLMLETINGVPAAASEFAPVFVQAGFRRGTTGLRFYGPLPGSDPR
jgi:ATP-dependent Lhr-like helicase